MSVHSIAVLVSMSSALIAACDDTPSEAQLTAIFEPIVRNRASLEFPCPSDQLTIEDLEGGAFRATGCAAYATYECAPDNFNGDFLYDCKRAVSDAPEHVDAGI